MESEPLEYTSEDSLIQAQVALKEDEFNSKCEPPDWLNEAESPFKWLIFFPKTLVVLKKDFYQRVVFFKNEGPDSVFCRYATLLTFITMKAIGWYNLAVDSSQAGDSSGDDDGSSIMTGDSSVSTEGECDLEEAYSMCTEALDEMATQDGDMYSRIGPALLHVLQATRAHMLFLQGSVAQSKEIANCIQPVVGMSPECQAAFEGIKTSFLLDISTDDGKTLETCRKAVKLDPNFAPWRFRCGILKRRLRKHCSEENYMEELECFEKALELERSLKHLLFLAQAYQEVSSYLRFNNRVSSKAEELDKRAVETLRECWSFENNKASIARRVGNIMMKIRSDKIDLALAKEALLKAVEMQPADNTYHAMGRFYYKHEMDDEKALEYFGKAKGVFGGTGEILRLKLIKDPDYDPHDIIEKWVKIAPKTLLHPESLYCDIAWYYLTFKKDLETSAKYFWEVLKNDFQSPSVMKFKSFPFCVRGPLNMAEIMVNEILMLKERNKCLTVESGKNMTFLESFLEKVLEKHPELVNYRPNPHVMNDEQRNVANEIRRLRKKRYGHTARCGTSGGQLENSYQRFRGGRDMRNNRDEANNRLDSFTNSSKNNADGRMGTNSSHHRYDVDTVNWRTEKRN